MALTRREFLCRSFGAFGAAVLAFERFGLLQALAQAGDYKALVCIFLFGGNDSGNMIIPYDDYGVTRPFAQTAGSPCRSPAATHRRAQYRQPICPPSRSRRLARTLGRRKDGVVCNAGPLVEPTSRDSYRNGTDASHSTSSPTPTSRISGKPRSPRE